MEVALNALDATADGVTTTAPFAKPALIALAKLTPHGALKRGDRAQASTLNMLEDTSDIMEKGMHNILQNGFDKYVVSSAYSLKCTYSLAIVSRVRGTNWPI